MNEKRLCNEMDGEHKVNLYSALLKTIEAESTHDDASKGVRI